MSTIFPDGITFLKQYRKQPSVTGPSEAPTTGEGLHDEEWITMEPSWKEKLTAEASKIQVYTPKRHPFPIPSTNL